METKKGSSWLIAIRRAFRASTSQHDEHQQEEERKRDKKRWKFHKSTAQDQQEHHQQVKVIKGQVTAEQRHAIALAVATAATAEAALVTAQAAAEAVRLTRQVNPSFIKEHRAAVVMQNAFRGYLARRALRALKGLVKLQALVRGHNVRKQANMTFRCMQALLRVQARAREERMRLSQDGAGCGTKSLKTVLDAAPTLGIDIDRPSITPSPSRAKPIQVWSSSPRCIREDRTLFKSNKPSLTAYYNHSGNGATRHQQTTLPNYMAATQSARARVRSQSLPRQRPGTPERDRTGPVKKRLSFPIPDSYYRQSKLTLSSCGGEVSPSSTTDFSRWLR